MLRFRRKARFVRLIAQCTSVENAKPSEFMLFVDGSLGFGNIKKVSIRLMVPPPEAKGVTQPVWIDCGSGDVGPPGQLAAQASGGHHIVLRFPMLHADEKAALIDRLSTALPEFSVFDSGGGPSPAWVTIMPVVAKARVLDRRAEVLRALSDYRRACAALVEQYRGGILPREWRSSEHGGHCRFTNCRTGQIVEAPFRHWADPDRVDPYFFAEFVKTTAGFEAVAELIDHHFHDGARILEVVGAAAQPGRCT
jgi:hypothetical protein